MSTKIYNAYSLKSMSITELDTFLKELKSKCQDDITKTYYKEIVRQAAHIIDICSLYKANQHVTEFLYSDIHQHIASLYEEATQSPIYKLTAQPKPFSKEEAFKEINGNNNLAIRFFATSLVENRCQSDEITNKYGDVNTKNEIILFPTKDNKILCQVFGDNIIHLMESLTYNSQYQDFIIKYDIKDYHYQNQTDQPEDISDEDWEKRRQDWDTYMPSGIPSRDGICIELTNQTFISAKAFFTKAEELLSYAAPKEERIEKLAKELTQTMFIKPDADFSDIMDSLRTTDKEIKNKNGERYQTYVKYCTSVLNNIIPELTPELLKAPLNSFITLE